MPTASPCIYSVLCVWDGVGGGWGLCRDFMTQNRDTAKILEAVAGRVALAMLDAMLPASLRRETTRNRGGLWI